MARNSPIELTLGAGQVIPGFEKALEGMSPGESKQVDVPTTEAYGPRREENIIEFDRSRTPAETEVGQEMQLKTQDGRTLPAVVTEMSDTSVKVDANHPLAGRDLTFDLELLEIV